MYVLWVFIGIAGVAIGALTLMGMIPSNPRRRTGALSGARRARGNSSDPGNVTFVSPSVGADFSAASCGDGGASASCGGGDGGGSCGI